MQVLADTRGPCRPGRILNAVNLLAELSQTLRGCVHFRLKSRLLLGGFLGNLIEPALSLSNSVKGLLVLTRPGAELLGSLDAIFKSIRILLLSVGSLLGSGESSLLHPSLSRKVIALNLVESSVAEAYLVLLECVNKRLGPVSTRLRASPARSGVQVP